MDNNHCCACGIGECMGHWFFKTADKMVVCSDCLLKIQTVLGKAFKMTLTDKEEKAFAKSHTSDYFIENVKGIESITDLKDGLSFVVNYEKKTLWLFFYRNRCLIVCHINSKCIYIAAFSKIV